MKFGKLLATATIAGMAVLGLSAPAFATTHSPDPGPTCTAQTWQNCNQGGQWGGKPGGDNQCRQGDRNWGDQNKNCDPNGNKCDPKGHQSDQQGIWNQDKNCGQGDGNKCRDQRNTWTWNRDCGQGDCHFLPVLTTWDNHGQWTDGRGNCGDHNGDHRGHRNHCFNQLVIFNFPHGSSTLTETQGPWLAVNEVAFYQGQTYTIASVTHTGLVGHDRFTVTDTSHQLVVNSGPPIRHGVAHLLTCAR